MNHAVKEIYNKIYEHLKPALDEGKAAQCYVDISSTGNVCDVELSKSNEVGRNIDTLRAIYRVNGTVIDEFRLLSNGLLLVKETYVEDNGTSSVYSPAKLNEHGAMIAAIYKQLFDKDPVPVSVVEWSPMVGDMNPFNHDCFRMGTIVNNEWAVMYSSLDANELILVNQLNGRRFELDVGYARIK